MIADRVQVRTRSYRGEPAGSGSPTGPAASRSRPPRAPCPAAPRSSSTSRTTPRTSPTPGRIKEIVRRYSSFVPHPIRLGTGEVVNDQKPIWVEPKSQVTEEQYTRFYQHLTHHTEETPLWHLHLAADSPIQFRAILYCPPTNLERLGFGRLEHGVSLCAKRVLVQNDCRELLPEYLRFLYGLVDSEDLPLNVSRETLQDNTVIRRIRNSLVKGVLDRLDQLAKEKPRRLQDVLQPVRHDAQGRGDRRPRQPRAARQAPPVRLVALPRIPRPRTSLDDYVARMPEDQKRIYYLGGPDLASIRKSPNLEIFRRRGLEVLFLTEPIDEFVMTPLGLARRQAAHLDRLGRPRPARGQGGRGRDETGEEAESKAAESGFSRVLDLFREALGDRVREVRESKRLTDSPCCLVNAEGGFSTQMQRLLKMANKDFPETARILEINPVVALDPPALPPERQPRSRRLHQAVRAPALVQRPDPRRDHSRARRPGGPDPGLHGRGRREAVAADSCMTIALMIGDSSWLINGR